MRTFIVLILLSILVAVVWNAVQGIRHAARRQEEQLTQAPGDYFDLDDEGEPYDQEKEERLVLLDELEKLVEIVYADRTELFRVGYMEEARKRSTLKDVRHNLTGLKLRGEGKDPFGVFDPTPFIKPELLEDGESHPCVLTVCTNTVQFDDEPYCFEHSPDSGSSLRGYSYKEMHGPNKLAKWSTNSD